MLLATAAAAQHPGESLSISLVTMGPGDNYWERFGHNAILIEDLQTRDAALYNYGVFDFRQDSFLLNFLRGRMQYQLMPFDPTADFARYVAADRDVRIQYLRLTPDQRLTIAQFLAWNAKPENAPYRYDYFLDNCSTRIRDVLDDAMGGALSEATRSVEAAETYRFHAERLAAPNLPLYLGVRLALGRPVDRPISNWDVLFIPEKLFEAVGTMQIRDDSGALVPLVERVWHLHESDRHDGPAEPPRQPWLALLAGLTVAGLLLWLLSNREGSWVRRVGATCELSWIWGASLAGIFLLWLALGSEHYAAHFNENILVLNPITLALLSRVRRWAATALLLMVGLALVMKLLPGSQQNLSLLLALAPVQLAVAWGRLKLTNPSFGT